MNNKLLFLSKNDIPFPQAGLIIHQPILKDIALLGEQDFFTGCEYLNFSKDILSQQDKVHLNHLSDFEILMTMITKGNDIAFKHIKDCLQLVLFLIFPDYKIVFLPLSIMFIKDDEKHYIDKENFESFKNIVSQMFNLKQLYQDSGVKKYNPGGKQAAALAKKFQERHKKLAQIKNTSKDGEEISIIAKYVSILAVGLQKDINNLMQYSVYQLFDEFQRFRNKYEFDIYVEAKMAGAKDLEEIENWMG